MGLEIYQVDAFTDCTFKGNPAAVCILPEPQSEEWMQNVAGEMNLSETAFLVRREDGYDLRWFTPVCEVDLCGHATLASAHILWELGELKPGEQARFHTRSGLLTAGRQGDWIEMNFPAEPEEETMPPPELVKGLGIDPQYTGKNRMDYLVETDSEETVRNLKPDFQTLGGIAIRGIIVTALSARSDYDFVSRFFAPGAGVDEDPVTGSAHCCLGPYWKKRLGKEEFIANQVSARGGIIKVRVQEDRVVIAGQAVTVFHARLNC